MREAIETLRTFLPVPAFAGPVVVCYRSVRRAHDWLDLDVRISAYPLSGITHSVSYDPASRITGITGSSTKTYGYDALDRLTSFNILDTHQTYSYDANGNRLTLTEGAQTTAYSYGVGSNRIEGRTQGTTQSYSYDPAGNLTDDGAHSFTYDDRGRMVQAMTGALTTSFRYNGLGQRVSRTAPGSSTVSRRFVYDESGHLIGEYDGSGAPIQETAYLGDLPIAVLSGADGIHYVHADQISTPRVITDSQGAVVWRWESDPFGVGSPDQDPDGDGVSFFYNLRMPGQSFDAKTGLHYNYYRDYDPSLGRYVQSDPIGLAGGLNTYAYALNNPLYYVDPDGRQAAAGALPGFGSAASAAAEGAGVAGGATGILGPAAAVAGAGLAAYGVGTLIFPSIEPGLSRLVDYVCRTNEKEERCRKEWEDAYRQCDKWLSQPNPPRGLTGGYANRYDCARGLVSEERGGNPVDHGRGDR